MNDHIEHIEDLVFDGGIAGAVHSMNVLDHVYKFLLWEETSATITTKWDGSPALVFGINPENKQFFVGTKSVFAKTPKINYTDEDIERNHPFVELQNVLKTALRVIKSSTLKEGIFQGDVLFIRESVVEQPIEGEWYATFTPNAITYAVHQSNELFDDVRNADLGICIHTRYIGDKMDDLKPSFENAYFPLTQGMMIEYPLVVQDELENYGTLLSLEQIEIYKKFHFNIRKAIKTLRHENIKCIVKNDELVKYIKKMSNQLVRLSKTTITPDEKVTFLLNFVSEQTLKFVNEAKKEETKQKRRRQRCGLMSVILNERQEFVKIFELQNHITEAKVMMLECLKSSNPIRCFLKTDSKYTPCKPEGYVVSLEDGTVAKLVDRTEFSAHNFLIHTMVTT